MGSTDGGTASVVAHESRWDLDVASEPARGPPGPRDPRQVVVPVSAGARAKRVEHLGDVAVGLETRGKDRRARSDRGEKVRHGALRDVRDGAHPRVAVGPGAVMRKLEDVRHDWLPSGAIEDE